jgi:Flp pilus assembly secretin CpaC
VTSSCGRKSPGRSGLFFVLLAAAVVGAAHASEELTVGVGEQRIVTAPAGSDIGYTGPLHVTRLDATRVKIIGDGPGWGSVTIKSGNDVLQYSVTVVAVPPEQTVAKLRSLLGGMNLTYAAAGDRVIIEGRIETTRELERFNRIIEAFPQAINMAEITAREPLVDIAVTLVEVDVASSSGFGLLDFDSPTSPTSMSGAIPLSDITGGTISPGNFKVSFALSAELLQALKAQVQNGRAKVIANPRVVTMSRKQAVITSGGEIPYRVVGATGGQGVEYKPYGITLKVTPEERTSDVLLHLELESSEPVGSVSGSSQNPLTSRSVVLDVAVEKDKTLAIAGLYNAVTSRGGRGGCLFPLFATASSTRRREIIVLVTPRASIDGIQQDHFQLVKPADLKR